MSVRSVAIDKLLIPFVSAALGGLIAAFVLKPAEIDYQTLVGEEIAAFELLTDALVERAYLAARRKTGEGGANPPSEADLNARRMQHRANIMLAMYGFPSQLLAHQAYLLARHEDAEERVRKRRARGDAEAELPHEEFLIDECALDQRITEDVRIYSLWRRQLFRGVWSTRWLFGTADRFADEAEESRVLALLVHNCRLP
ncbi:MAG: hypothetical protein R3D25_13740 [Geminicoccaceae bacterium]